MSHSDNNTIDLTLDDDEEQLDSKPTTDAQRYVERFQPQQAPQAPTPSPSTSQSSSTMSGPSLSPFTRPAYTNAPICSPSIFAPPIFPGAPNPFATYAPQPYHPAFAAGPGAYRPPQDQPAPSPPNFNNVYHQQFQRQQPSSPGENERNIIDLTSSPSPPPSSIPRVSSQPPLPVDLPPKTPVCIGQLTLTALILYPVPYTTPLGLHGEPEWAPIRLQYEHTPHKEVKENICIRTPSTRGPNNENLPGDIFAVAEKKAAAYLGPMLGKGLIRLDGLIRKGPATLPILPLQTLVYTPKGNIPVVSNYLEQCDLLLDHPSPLFNGPRLTNYHYFNPHEGIRRAAVIPQPSRWQTTAARSTEIQRSQVDQLFKSLKDDDDFPETEPCPEIATKLYPHQKKAVTFLLDREREQPASESFSSLWQQRVSQITGQISWLHLVTHKEEYEAPKEAKGAILADDMGLGKTITCVSLIGATYDSSVAFSTSPLETVPRPPLTDHDSLDASHFADSVWGIAKSTSLSNKSKGKAKAEGKAQGRLEAEYTRCCRIKAKSRATLIICPLSTVSNWEDQFREHWKGEVAVVGGQGGCNPPPATPSSSQPVASGSQMVMDAIKTEKDEKSKRIREGRGLRVYIYHGNARRPDPAFLADFDAVITTYATLASEFSKQNKARKPDEDEDDGSEDVGGTDVDEYGQGVMRPTKKAKTNGKKKKHTGNGQSNNSCEQPSALQSIHWFRVVLDEAHSIKETGTVASRACCDLMADRRLCLTGTPVQNKLDDIFALVKFLRLEPFDDKNIWTEYIGGPVKYGQELGISRLQTIMKCITLRRTKETKAPDGTKILDLPPRKDVLHTLQFEPHEKEIYDRFFMESKQEFADLNEKNEVMKNYVGILQKILRLRQICDHFELVEGKGPQMNPDCPGSYEDIISAIANEGFTYPRAAAVFAILRESATTQCVECGTELCVSSELGADPAEGEPTTTCPAKRGRKGKVISSSRGPTRANSPSTPRPVLTRCQHLFCMACYRNSICPGWPMVPADTRRACSACQTALSPTDAFEITCDSPSMECAKKKPQKREKRQKGQVSENYVASSKIKALMLDLEQFSKLNPYSANYDPELEMTNGQGGRIEPEVVKTVVFSQWTSMLDKVEDAFELANIRYERLDGTMRREERVKAMEALKHDPSCEVLLVSLKAGGVGLNLTAAQRCYLLDPYWNPAVENQAVDRIHRLGQTRPVTTIKYVIEGSIEERLLEVQKKKTELANMTLNHSTTKAEILQRRLDELSALFGS